MKRLAPFLFCLLCGLLSAAGSEPNEPHWQRTADMPLAVFAAKATLSRRQAVICGGIDQKGATRDLVQLFDLDRQTWAKPLRLHEARCSHAQVTLGNGQILLAGGQSGPATSLSPLASSELIDLTKRLVNCVAPLPSFAASPTGHLLPDGRAIVIGGQWASIFDPKTERWSTQVRLRQARRGHCSALLGDGRVMVLGGARRRSLEVVNPIQGTSQLLSHTLPQMLDDAVAIPIGDGRVWLSGGQDSHTGNTTDQTWIVTERSIRPGPRLAIDGGVADHLALKRGRWAVVVGGETQRNGHDSELRSVRLLHLPTQTVRALAATQWPHDDAAAILDGQHLFIFGGFGAVPLPAVAPRLPIALSVVEHITLPSQRGLMSFSGP